MDFNIRVADRHILIHSVYSLIHSKCEPYRTDEITEPEIEIRINESMIRAETEKIKRSFGHWIDSPSAEHLVVHRLLAEEMLSFDTLLMHGAVPPAAEPEKPRTYKAGCGMLTARMW